MNMESLKERPGGYHKIVATEFSSFLAELGRRLENVRKWPMRISDFSLYPHPEALGLKTEDMRWLLVDVRRRGIMDPVHSSAIHRSTEPDCFDIGRCLALGALAWVIAGRYEKNKKGITNITGSRETFPWEFIVADAKSFLGENPLTKLYYPNGRPETIFVPQPRRKRVVKKAPVPPEVPIIIDGKPVIIRDRFPVFDQKEQASVEKMDLAAVTSLLGCPPGNSLDEVDLVRHAPEPVVRAVAFIRKAGLQSLVSYKRYEESYSLLEFCNGLKICSILLDRYKNIKNVYQLVKVYEQMVLREPLKYWNSQTKPK